MAVLLGQSTTGVNSANANNNGTPFAQKYTALATGTIDTVWVFNGGTATLAPRAAIYADSAGAPGARLAQVGPGATAGVNAWYSLALTFAVTSGTVYWLAWMTATPNQFTYTDNATSGGTERDGPTGQASFPDPFGTTTFSGTNIVNMYASGSVAGGIPDLIMGPPRR